MNKLLLTAKVSALVSICILCISLSVLLINASRTLTKLDAVLPISTEAITNLNKALIEVNRPCGQDASCGTLADVNKAIGTTRDAMGQLEIAAAHEDRQLGTLDRQELQLYTDTHDLILAGQGTLNSTTTLLTTTNTAVQGVAPLLMDARGTIAGATVAVGSLNTVVSNPDIPKTLQAVQESATASAGTMVAVKGTTQDVEQAVHSYLHPTWGVKVWNWTADVLHIMNPF